MHVERLNIKCMKINLTFSRLQNQTAHQVTFYMGYIKKERSSSFNENRSFNLNMGTEAILLVVSNRLAG